MLCAAWELYVEELLVESAGVLSGRASSPGQLPLAVQKEIAKAVRESKHELKPLELAGDGWQHVYVSHVTRLASGLNTPKSTIVDPLFERLTGTVEVSSAWSVGADTVNDFVKARGEIAHRGRAAAYVTINSLRSYREQLIRTVLDTDNAMADSIKAESLGGSPWRRRTV